MLDVQHIEDGKKIKITLVKSPINYGDSQNATVKALKLRRMHASRELILSPNLRGMIHSVRHLVRVELAEGA
ncbi:MAG: 50S ribosomal protein L30 [Anaerolineae bacterium]|jgi:large subunit ribosomal protein L30|nr:50S ribosomal protein L30 [Anaerolineae bacterium]